MPKRSYLSRSSLILIGVLVVLFIVGFIAGPLGKSILGDLGLGSVWW